MRDPTRTLWDRHAIRWAEHLITLGRNDDAALLLRAVDRRLDDEGALAEAAAAVGATLEQIYTLMDMTLFRLGKRVRSLPTIPCERSWDPTRPCVLGMGHSGSCDIADVNTAHQRAMLAQLAADMGAVIAAVASAGQEVD